MIKILLVISLGMAFFSQISGLPFLSLVNSFALILGWLVLFLIFLSGGISFLGGWLSRSKKPSLSLLKIKRKERVLFFTPHPDDETLAAGVKQGYNFTMNPVAGGGGLPTTYTCNADPQSPQSGRRTFFLDETGVLRFENTGAAATAASPPIGG